MSIQIINFFPDVSRFFFDFERFQTVSNVQFFLILTFSQIINVFPEILAPPVCHSFDTVLISYFAILGVDFGPTCPTTWRQNPQKTFQEGSKSQPNLHLGFDALLDNLLIHVGCEFGPK